MGNNILRRTWPGRLAAALVGAGGLLAVSAGAAYAQETPSFMESADAQYIFNTLLFLIGGFLVMWMAAGFAMLEAGSVRSRNAATICLKNIGLYAIAGIMFYFVGYNLLYPGTWTVPGYIGEFSMWSSGGEFAAISPPDPETATAAEIAAYEAARAASLDTGYSASSDWFFQMVFVATAASIVSGTVAERIKLFPFFIFTAVLTAVIYPIQCSWQWGGGWLSEAGFSDFAGSTLVHSVGGWAALVGAILVGSRVDKYDQKGAVQLLPGSNLPLVTLGTFILWLGWFGFNGASQLAMGTISDAASVSRIFLNTNMAAAGGTVTAIILTRVIMGRADLPLTLNGALGGLVAITAEPLMPEVWQALIIGGVGGAIVVFGVPFLNSLRIDDAVGAVPVHLFAGIFGTLIVPWTNTGVSIVAQLTGVVAIGVFVSVSSLIVWLILKLTTGLRLSDDEQLKGGDVSEAGHQAYPEWHVGQGHPAR